MRVKSIPLSQINAQEAIDKHKQISRREEMRRALFIENIADLVDMYDKQEYKAVLGADPPPTWAGYLGQIEIFYSRAQVERWRKVWQVLVNDYQIAPNDLLAVPESRLEEVARYASSKDQAIKLLEVAETASAKDWKDEVAEFLGKPSTYDCNHDNKVYTICKKCGDKHEVQIDNEHADIKVQS